MTYAVNRGKTILKNWEEQERKLSEAAPKDANLSIAISQEKYKYLVRGLARLSISPSVNELVFAGLIKLMVKNLRVQFYPNPIVRTLFRLREKFVVFPREKKSLLKLQERNFSQMDKLMKDRGIDGMTSFLKDQLDFERNEIPLTLMSRFHENETLDITLRLQKDGMGNYQMAQVEAAITNSILDETKKCAFDGNYGLDVNQSIYLLKGGSVLLSTENGIAGEKWLQLDLEKVDVIGNYPVRELVFQNGLGLEEMVKQAGIDLDYPLINQPGIIETMKRGAQASFEIEGNSRFYLEVNARTKELLFRNDSMEVVPLLDVKKVIQESKQIKEIPQTKLKEISQSKSKSKDKGLGI